MWRAGKCPAGLAASITSFKRSNDASFTRLENLPAFEQICAAAGGYGERVEDPAELPADIQRALSVVKNEGRQALLNVIRAS